MSIMERVVEHEVLEEGLNGELNRLREEMEEARGTERRREHQRREGEGQIHLQH